MNIHHAKTHLSKLVEQALNGEPFIIAKAGKPLVKVTALDANKGKRKKRIGFMKGKLLIPDDFDELNSAEIEKLFGGNQ